MTCSTRVRMKAAIRFCFASGPEAAGPFRVAFDQDCSVSCTEVYVLNGNIGEVWKCDVKGFTLELTGALHSCNPLPCPTIGSILGMEHMRTRLPSYERDGRHSDHL